MTWRQILERVSRFQRLDLDKEVTLLVETQHDGTAIAKVSNVNIEDDDSITLSGEQES